MNSELTEKTDIRECPTERHARRLPGNPYPSLPQPKDSESAASFRGWILYDGDCPSCTASARRFDGIFRRRGFLFLPLQTEWVMQQLGLEPGAALKEMHVLTGAGEDIAGANAVIFLARQIWWAWPFALLAQLPGIHSVLDRGYRWVAAHRGCDDIACEFKERRFPSRRTKKTAVWTQPLLEIFPAWVALIALPISVLPLRDHLAPWQFMWLMAGAIFFGCKWLTAWRAQTTNPHLKLAPTLGYFFAWPGMDAEKFLDSPPPKLDGFKPSNLRARTVEGRASARPGRAEARPFIDRSNNKDFSGSGAVVCCCALRSTVAIRRLDRNDRHDSHPAFRAVPASRDRMAQGRSRCGTDHECAVAFENS
jgi:predicted DCC family thiol-disulfide oxidoreductase YuxK